MKKLALSIILVLASFSSFSQNVILSEKQAKAVVKDLIAGQSCKEELEQTQSVLELTETKVKLKDKVIQNLEKQKSELLAKELLRVEQLDSKDKIIYDTEKQLKKQKKLSWLYKAGTLTGLLVSGFLIFSK